MEIGVAIIDGIQQGKEVKPSCAFANIPTLHSSLDTTQLHNQA